MQRPNLKAMIVLLVSVASANLVSCSGPYADQPQQERDFVLFLVTARSKWRGAANSIEREPLPRQRDDGLCQFGNVATDWVGTVDRVGSFISADYASLRLKIFENITVRTGDDLQGDRFKIARTSAMFDILSQLRQGAKVIFSGKFALGDNGCPTEWSLTNNGDFTEPEFIMSFSELRRAP